MLQNGVPQFVGFCRCTPCRQRRGKGKFMYQGYGDSTRCTPCRQRRGKAKIEDALAQCDLRCTPCRQRRGKAVYLAASRFTDADAPRAGSAEAKETVTLTFYVRTQMHPVQAAPRQRSIKNQFFGEPWMHPVQAAPRQSWGMQTSTKKHYDRCTPCRQRKAK